MADEFWKDRNVLVTGCTGLLGSWLTKSLCEKEANVIGLIRDLVPRSNLNWLGFDNNIVSVRGEIEDYFLLERTINEYEIDTVFHLAAQTIVTIANRNLTMVEGGAVLTDDPPLKKIIASFRDWGRDCWCDPGCNDTCKKRFDWQLGSLPAGYDHKYIYSLIGYNLKATDMQAAVGV